MKVIDLLNKKANREELPSEINCYNQTFYLSDGIYIAKNQVGKYFEDYFDFSSLDYEVEIIEDTPKEYINVSEEQVLFNNLSYEEQQFILRQMRMLQPCKLETMENKYESR